ncbi:hypothetical protein ACOMHN_027975 [Nucella lapillus]
MKTIRCDGFRADQNSQRHCVPREEERRPPPLPPPSMQFTGQTVSEDLKSFTYTQERYDARARLVVVDYLGTSPFTARYGADSLTVVSDFNTGTEYVVDAKRGNCSIAPLTSDPDLDDLADPTTLRLKSAAAILDLTGADYTYVGERPVRGVPCHTWITQMPGSGAGAPSVNVTNQWAFTQAKTDDIELFVFFQPGWRTLNDPGGVRAVPMQLVHTQENGGRRQQTVKNVYNYVGGVADVLAGVTVDSCFIGLPRNLVVFSISNVYSTLLQYFQQEFRHAVRHSVAEVLSISPLRVANIQCRPQQLIVDVWLDLLSVRPQGGTPATQRPLDDATQDLIAAVAGNRLVIELFGYAPRPTYITADSQSLRIRRFNQVQTVSNRPTPLPAQPSGSSEANTTSAHPASQHVSVCQPHGSPDTSYPAGHGFPKLSPWGSRGPCCIASVIPTTLQILRHN